MSTRSNISIKRKDGTYDKIYCHSDGYLEYNGRILDTFYKVLMYFLKQIYQKLHYELLLSFHQSDALSYPILH